MKQLYVFFQAQTLFIAITGCSYDGRFYQIGVPQESKASVTTPSSASVASALPTVCSSGGSGASLADPVRICDAVGLNRIRLDLSLHYILEADIDLSTSFSIAGDFYNAGAGWDPIGTTASPFTGSLNGNGKQIKGLFINRPSDSRTGLFGEVGSFGLIKNLKLSQVNITGGIHVGALAGFSNGTVEQIQITGGQIIGVERVGGLIGRINGAQAKVSESESDASVTGTGSTGYGVGGLLGWIEGGGLLQSSSSSGVVVGISVATGGLVGGLKNGLISNCLASGNVSGNTRTGGLVGYIYPSSDTSLGYTNPPSDFNSVIEDSHATGNVSATGDMTGGLIGRNGHGTIRRSFATGNVTGVNNVGGLAGESQWVPGLIEDTYATGSVTATGDRIGGVIGYNNSSVIVRRSYATGNISGNSDVGGLVGRNTASVVGDSFAAGNVLGGGAAVGGLIGSNNYTNPTKVQNSVWINGSASSHNCVGVNSDPSDTFCSVLTNASLLYATTSVSPFTQWNFSTVWKTQPLGFPLFQ